MATELEEVGPPIIGLSFKLNRQVAAPGTNNRTIARRYKMRLADLEYYTVPIINPTLRDAVYPLAIIIDQDVERIGDNKTDAYLLRTFAEIPTEWDEAFDEVATFPGVLPSNLYAPGEFQFRSGPSSIRTSIRINRRYFLSNPAAYPRIPKFQAVDSDGRATSVISDYTTPSADEYISMVLGRQEIAVSSIVKPWRGDIHFRETVFAEAK